MTIGERIKFFRMRRNMTQNQLAANAEIHPVSIRKYEINKMQPQKPQIERLATALGISYNALSGNTDITLETVGDLMGILISLCNSQIIIVGGDREANDMLRPESIVIQLNPMLERFFEVSVLDRDLHPSLNEVLFRLTSPLLLNDFLTWEKMDYIHKKVTKADNPNEDEKALIADIARMKEEVELVLQSSVILLDTSNGITVKLPSK